MKKKLLLILFLIGAVASYGQKLIDEKNVPKEIISVFKKKMPGSTEAKWFQKDQIFTVKYMSKEYPGEAQFTREGVILMTKLGIDPETLPASVQTDLAKTQKGKRIHEAFLITKGKKEKYYSIILHEKQGRKQEPLVYEAHYTMQGKLITIYEPQIEEETVEDQEEKPSKFSKEVDEEVEELKEKVKDEKISRKDLPSEAESYLTENFDHEYRAKEILVKSNSEYGQYYEVIMKKQGEKIEHILLFDYKGNLLKRKEVQL